MTAGCSTHRSSAQTESLAEIESDSEVLPNEENPAIRIGPYLGGPRFNVPGASPNGARTPRTDVDFGVMKLIDLMPVLDTEPTLMLRFGGIVGVESSILDDTVKWWD